jgi:hypothetical protein
MSSTEKPLCPSHKCVSGSQLIGIVQADGSVAFLGNPQPVDQQFLAIAARGRAPELRFRFANTCAQGACANWAGDCCGIAAQISAAAETNTQDLPDCGIRPECRWYAERSARACAVCPRVVRGAETGASSSTGSIRRSTQLSPIPR